MSSKERGYVQLVMLMWLTGPIQDLYTSPLMWKRGLDAISHYGYISWSVQSCILFEIFKLQQSFSRIKVVESLGNLTIGMINSFLNCMERLRLIQPGSSRPWKGSSTSETRDRAALSHSGVWYLLQQRGRQERHQQLERQAKKCVW